LSRARIRERRSFPTPPLFRVCGTTAAVVAATVEQLQDP
jgi:hypothetical protein